MGNDKPRFRDTNPSDSLIEASPVPLFPPRYGNAPTGQYTVDRSGLKTNPLAALIAPLASPFPRSVVDMGDKTAMRDSLIANRPGMQTLNKIHSMSEKELEEMYKMYLESKKE